MAMNKVKINSDVELKDRLADWLPSTVLQR